jgi:hypothetical protein
LRPLEGLFAFLDVMLVCAVLIVEPYDPTRLHGQVGDDEIDFLKSLTRMPCDHSDDPTCLDPRCSLIFEIPAQALDLGLRSPPQRPRPPMSNFVAQRCIGGQPNGLEIAA